MPTCCQCDSQPLCTDSPVASYLEVLDAVPELAAAGVLDGELDAPDVAESLFVVLDVLPEELALLLDPFELVSGFRLSVR